MERYIRKFISLDLETTHLDMREGKIMEVGAVEVKLYIDNPSTQPSPRLRRASEQEHNSIVKVKFGKKFSTLVNPEVEPSATALMLTGIKADELSSAPKWKEVEKQLAEFLGEETILGHNIGFDLGYLMNQGLKLKNDTLDTLELALTILPLHDSHSLEFLAESYQVLTSAPHRALTDSENCARVLPQLLNEFLRYPAKLQQEIKDILKKSEIGFAELILDLPEIHNPLNLPAGQAGPPYLKGEDKTKRTPPTKSAGSREGLLDLDFQDQTIYCFPLSFKVNQDLLASLSRRKEQALIGVSHPVYLDFLPENQRLASPLKALCEIRYRGLLETPDLPAILARILIKIRIFQENYSDSFDLSQIKWAWEETPFLGLFTTDPGICQQHNCGYVSDLKKSSRKIRFTDLKGVFHLALDWDMDFLNEKLLLFDLANIEDSFSEAVMQTFNLRKIRSDFGPLYPLEKNSLSWHDTVPAEIEEVANELDLFFGILHLVYLKREGEFSQNLVIDEEERDGERFSKLYHPAEKLIQKLDKTKNFLTRQAELADGELRLEFTSLAAKLENFSKFVNDLFVSPTPDNIYWLRFNHAWVDLNIQPKTLEDSWRKFRSKFSTVTIADTQLPKAALTYYEMRLGLHGFRTEKCFTRGAKPQPVPVKIVSKALPEPEQISLLENLSGRTLAVLPNENLLETFYQELHSRGSQVLAYKFSGNAVQIRSKLKRAGDHAMLLLTTNALGRYWRTLPVMENLVIVRLPFEALGTKPAILGLPRDSGFREYILPRAILQLHSILVKFVSEGVGQQQIFILDPRILTEYDRAFMNYLEEFPEFVISTTRLPGGQVDKV